MRTQLESPNIYTVGWIAALPIERAAATALLDERHDSPKSFEQHQADTNSYTWGRMGEHNIVIASLPAGVYGTTSAATTASNLLSSLPHIKIGLLVGIGGGIPHLDQGRDIRLGDVVVSQPDGTDGGVVQYDLGKAKLNDTWERKGSLNKPPPVLLSALANLQAEHEFAASKIPDLLLAMWAANPQMKNKAPGFIHQGSDNDRLFNAAYKHGGGHTCTLCDPSFEVQRDHRHAMDPEVHYGIIASGNALIKDATMRDKIVNIAGENCICVEMEAAGLMDHFPCLVIRGICDYADSHKNDRWQRYASATAAAYAKELLSFVPARQLEATPRATDILKSIRADLKHGMQNIHTTIHEVDTRNSLAYLPVAAGASFDSHEESDNPVCLEQTRVEILDRISQWSESHLAEPIFWLNGKAGTGKSTISRSVAQRLHKAGRLGASFFFKRGEGDRGNSSRLVTTIVTQLAAWKPGLSLHIKKAIDADSSIPSKGLQEQFHKLLLQPLSKYLVCNDRAEPAIILIDALDECELGNTANDRARLVLSLFGRAKDVGLRVFLTSRPDLPIRLGFRNLNGKYEDRVLEKVSSSIVRHDIAVFLAHELDKIRRDHNEGGVSSERQLPPDWPGADIEKLADMAVPLFIFAETSLRFIRRGEPRERLAKILTYQRSHASDLDGIYFPVLDQLFNDLAEPDKTDEIGRFKQVVGSIVVLSSPLSPHSLARLLDVSVDIIAHQLRSLHSVLNVPEDLHTPVRLLHLSFRDFLVDPEKGRQQDKYPFGVDERQTHHDLATRCLQLLSTPNVLKQDICDLRQPGAARADIAQRTIDKCLPPEVQYACQYWVLHWKESKCLIQDGDGVDRFLTRHLLHWLEALSIVGRIPESLGMIRDLLGCLSTEHSKNISAFLHDTQRLILSHRSAIDQWPLQIYFSAIIFAPQKSVVRNTFSNKFPSCLSLLPQVDTDWDACFATLEGHSDPITSVAFSPDSQRLASGSQDGTVKLWDPRTGVCMATLVGHSEWVNSIAFSPDSQRLVSGSHDETVKLWDTTTGACTATLKGHSSSINSVAFSPDSQRLASGSHDKTVKLWDTTTGACIATLKGHSDSIKSVAFSPDSQRLASGSEDKTVRLWDTTIGAYIATLKGHNSWIHCVAFSPDSQWLASGSEDKTVKLWDTTMGACTVTLKGHSDSINSVAFSPDSQRLASGSYDETVKLWDTTTGAYIATLKGHSDSIKSVAFSPNSQRLASGSSDKTVKLWDTTTGAYIATLKGHSDPITSVAFSPDSQRLASGSYDETVKLWDTTTGAYIATLKGHSDSIKSVAFSPNSQRLASGSSDKTVKLWDTTTGAYIATLKGHSDPITSVAFSPDSQRLASGSRDGTVKLWDPRTGVCIATLVGHSHWVNSIAFSPDSQRLASGSEDKTVRLWDTTIGAYIATLKGHNSWIHCVAFSPDSQRLASGSHDKTVKLWDITTGAYTATLEGHRHWIGSVAFSPDSQRLASGSGDGTVKLWDPRTGACTATFEVGRSIRHLSFGRTGSTLHTDAGVWKLDRSPMLSKSGLGPNLQAKRSAIGLSDQSTWVVWDSSNLIWLPPAYRGLPAVMGSLLAVGCRSGRVYLLRYSSK